ncbi:hypothetical protein, partial [Treponema endosymbiont of Eucomonympha sp.]|uniref:hypothetical protein n=1 Tax=Treponema endosymbiont of Eucomonympha sp. TaxID=1580831 RepID=UPI000AECD424
RESLDGHEALPVRGEIGATGIKKAGAASRKLPPFPTCALALSGFLRNSRIVYDARAGMSKRNFGSSAGGFLRASVRRGTGYAVIGKAAKPLSL